METTRKPTSSPLADQPHATASGDVTAQQGALPEVAAVRIDPPSAAAENSSESDGTSGIVNAAPPTDPRLDPPADPTSIDADVQVLKEPGEVPIVMHSRITGPIHELPFLRRALLFAELSMIAYNSDAETRTAAEMIGFPDVTFYDRDGAQAYRFRNDYDCVITCRGTEPHEWNDIRADANAVVVVAETAGRVHRGFKQEVDDLWPMLEVALIKNDLPLWFCGHSLGAAMAKICASRCYLSHINSNPEELYTYGSPRVGDNAYVNFVRLPQFRFVNNNDIVTRVPPTWLGYRHSGLEVYFDRRGRIAKLGYLRKRRDRWRGFLRGLTQWRVDHFSDHSIHRYIEHILEAVRIDERRQQAGYPPVGYENVTQCGSEADKPAVRPSPATPTQSRRP